MISWELVRTVLRRPDLWAESVRTLLAMAPSGWWRRRPFLPLPDPAYSAWRVATAHGDADSSLSPAELISYLEWRRRQHRALRRI